MKYIARERNSEQNIITESSKTLNFLYNTLIGRIILRIIITAPISNLVAIYMNSSLSKHRIKKFVDKNDINTFEYEDKNYNSYNDFFTRKVISSKRPINARKDIFISPCDSKLLVYKITDDLTLNIKNSYYSIDTLIDDNIINEYKDGYALVFRLTTDNYHRYCYIDSGTKGKNYKIKGFVVSNIGNFDLLKEYRKDYELIGNFSLNIFNNISCDISSFLFLSYSA